MVDGDSVKVEILSNEDVTGLESVLRPSREGFIPWFQHPYNTDGAVPNAHLRPHHYGIAFHTASRTVVAQIEGRIFAIKMPTDHPFGPNQVSQPAKVRMDADLKYSVARSQAIAQIDGKLGDDGAFRAQKELAAVIDKKSGSGYLFRDLSYFKEGFFYLPAHLIPTIGKELAGKKGKSTIEFWKKYWAEKIGRIQAKIFYRYGMEVRAVNPQNFVIELDGNMTPTGTIIWRDLAESHLVEPIASRIGLGGFVRRDHENGGWGVHQKTDIESESISYQFDESNRDFTSETPDAWVTEHDQGFRKEIESAIGIRIPPEVPINEYLNDQIKMRDDSDLIKAIIQWHDRHGIRNHSFMFQPNRNLPMAA